MERVRWAGRRAVHTAAPPKPDAIFEVADQFRPAVSAIVVYEATARGPGAWSSGGTGLLVRTGSASFVLTAGHVVTKIQQVVRAQPAAAAILTGPEGATPVLVNDREMESFEPRVDMGVLRPPEDFKPGVLGKRWLKSMDWPPARAAVGDTVMILGCPSLHREGRGIDLHISFVVVVEAVASSSERHIVVADEDGRRAVHKLDPHLQDFGSFVGMSGAPVFAFRDGKAWLGGVFYEGGDGYEATFLAHHADFVTASGHEDTARTGILAR